MIGETVVGNGKPCLGILPENLSVVPGRGK